jgi:hypothetical protein
MNDVYGEKADVSWRARSFVGEIKEAAARRLSAFLAVSFNVVQSLVVPWAFFFALSVSYSPLVNPIEMSTLFNL